MSDGQEIVAERAAELVASGKERGPQVAASVDGQVVVDVAVGVADPAPGRAVEPGTLFYNWSIGKGATAGFTRWADPAAPEHSSCAGAGQPGDPSDGSGGSCSPAGRRSAPQLRWM